ncbi:MAG: molybdenum cofactor guanylyltransferase [Calditrichaeota bacterium]|nr:molybdenum cofactor guanylyltransferase [Calditrichota bacterium]
MEESFLSKNLCGAIILAGGKSSRFGSDKTLVDFQGAPLLLRVVNIVKNFTRDIVIVTNSPEKLTFLPYRKERDLIANCGPLGGIYTGLCHSNHEKNIVVPADMPFISAECIQYLLDQSEKADVTVPVHDNKYEPLCAIYSKSCIPIIKKQLESGDNQVFAFYDKVNTMKLNFGEELHFYHRHIFYNINSVRDLERLNFSWPVLKRVITNLGVK